MQLLERVINDILRDIREYIIPSAAFGIFAILIYSFVICKEKNIFKDPSYKWKFCFFMYIYFILNKTLLDRSTGMENNIELAVYKNWLTINGSADINAEALENIIFFMPYTFFLMRSLFLKNKNINLKKITVISFITSLVIEIMQYLLTFGTFQLSDIGHNTLGGMIGYLCFVLFSYIIKKNKK